MKDKINLLVAGVGGQGNVLISRIIGRALLEEGYAVWVGETFGMGQRGGSVVSHIRIGRDYVAPQIPKYYGELVLGLEPVETLRVVSQFLKKGGEVIMNPRPVIPTNVNSGNETYPSLEVICEYIHKVTPNLKIVHGTDLAQRLGNPQTLNMVMMGALAASKKIPVSIEGLRKALIEEVPKGTEDINLKAFDLGVQAYLEAL
ncbi:MAG: indolepyruvate oxidoreductase subunit beta [Candidatus Anstonellales archaeon]